MSQVLRSTGLSNMLGSMTIASLNLEIHERRELDAHTHAYERARRGTTTTRSSRPTYSPAQRACPSSSAKLKTFSEQ